MHSIFDALRQAASCAIVAYPMKQSHNNKISLLRTAHDNDPTDSLISCVLIKTLSTALDESEAERARLEKDIRTLELAIAKIDCTPRKV